MKKIFLVLGLFLLFPQFAQASELAEIAKAIPTYNVSVVIATGNTFQTVLKAAAGRRSLTIQNNNASDSCWLTFGVTVTQANAAKASSILLASGQAYTRFYPYIPSDEIEATCATSSDTLYIDTQ